MCQYCENEIPSGGGLEAGNEENACPDQMAESLRDAIRAFTATGGLSEVCGDEVDRCIDELVRRAELARPHQ